MNYEPISDKEEQIASAIMFASLSSLLRKPRSAYTVHNSLGPGLLENVYEVCKKQRG